ncbi:cohesin domain-containing protein [Massilia glaciei]|uniref:PEP-CTERM sorting domain-containing protein n=1 Tax=Massilia glaciei TaxID=1524097 RepID=A0A2U2HH48_9BURK|nr:cohesin domain-containing protein [Massilia glaciei]PWF45005.1 PEP-CTERM sorting domain-containing protein [Massilia glaciei]
MKTLKRLFCIALLLSCNLAQAKATLSVATPSNPVAVGDTIEVFVLVANANDLFGFQFDFVFDPTVFSAQSVTQGSFLPNHGNTFFIPGTIDNDEGVVGFNVATLLGQGKGAKGDGILLAFSFTAISAGTGTFSILAPVLLNSALNVLPFTTTTAMATVSPVPEPSAYLLLLIGLAGLAAFKRLGRGRLAPRPVA